MGQLVRARVFPCAALVGMLWACAPAWAAVQFESQSANVSSGASQNAPGQTSVQLAIDTQSTPTTTSEHVTMSSVTSYGTRSESVNLSADWLGNGVKVQIATQVAYSVTGRDDIGNGANGASEVRFKVTDQEADLLVGSAPRIMLSQNQQTLATTVDVTLNRVVGGVEQRIDTGQADSLAVRLVPGEYVLRIRVATGLSWSTFRDNVHTEARDQTVNIQFTDVVSVQGPAPTRAPGDVAGPYGVGSYKYVDKSGNVTPATKGTIFYPKTTSTVPFGVVSVAPGFAQSKASLQWLIDRIVSHGFVALVSDNGTMLDTGATKLANAQSFAYTAGLFWADIQKANGGPKVNADFKRWAIIGHDVASPLAQGGGWIDYTDPSDIKGVTHAVISLAPTSATVVASALPRPTLIVGCDGDGQTPSSTVGLKAYNALPVNQADAFLSLKAGSCANSASTAVVKSAVNTSVVAWLKRFVDLDKRYETFLCGPQKLDSLPSIQSTVKSYQNNCPTWAN